MPLVTTDSTFLQNATWAYCEPLDETAWRTQIIGVKGTNARLCSNEFFFSWL